MRIAVTGYKGRLGSELVKMGCVPLDCDITSGQSVLDSVEKERPDVIINCAAKTAVDKCSSDPEYYEEALKVNFRGAMKLRNNFRGHLIHISTDYVFDCSNGPYSENNDELLPVNDYGWTKYGAEAALTSVFSEGKTTIVRTTGLYGSDAKEDFATNVIKTLSAGERFLSTYELKGNQTYIPHLSEALIKLAGLKIRKKNSIIHIGSEEVISRDTFAALIAKRFDLNPSLLIPCRNQEIPGWVAVRPKQGGLKVSLAKALGLPIYSITDGLTDFKNRGEKL